jgi:hypothetical protein
VDPLIHRGTVAGTIEVVLDVLRSRANSPEPKVVRGLYRDVRPVHAQVRGRGGMFSRGAFLDLVTIAAEAASQRGVLAARPA